MKRLAPTIFAIAIVTALVIVVYINLPRTIPDTEAVSLFQNASIKMPPGEILVSSSGVDVAAEVADPKSPPDGYIEYRNDKYGFYYYHSPEAVITEYDEGGGAITITQENVSKMRGMQIFIVPYDSEVITEERFLKDVPSGVRYNIENTTVGEKKVPAVTFYSHDSSLGETRELWFIQNGYLYEVTTFKGFGDWFSSIIQTWRFI